MKTGYVRNVGSTEDFSAILQAFEQARCDRIVCDGQAGDVAGEGLLSSLLKRLQAGDTLVVWKLDCLADSLDGLIETVLGLCRRGVAFQSLKDGLMVAGDAADPAMLVLETFWKFESDRRAHFSACNARRALHRHGRPKALTQEEAQHACRQVIAQNRPIDTVAREFGVSRATLYRYLDLKK